MIPADLYKKIRRLEVRTRGRVEEYFGGRYHSAFKGRGMTFAEVRPYAPGDDVRAIDWNVSARTGETFVKVYEEEREQTVLLVVDASASADAGSVGRFKRDVAAEVCALLAFSASRGGDKTGLVLFAGEVERFVPPGRSRTHALRLVRDLYAHAPATPGTDLAGALGYARRVLRRRAVVVVVSDFAATGYEAALGVLAARHDVVAVVLTDPRDAALPAALGLVALRDAETGETVWLDARQGEARRAFAANATRRLDATRAALRRTGVDAVEVATDADPVVPLGRFFAERNRRLAR